MWNDFGNWRYEVSFSLQGGRGVYKELFDEYQQITNLEGALNIDYFSTTFSDEISKIGFETPVLVYCKSGNRSGKSMKIMNDLGFNEVYNLIGGFKGWVSGKNTITKD
mgnify:CR=1 FL=1